MVTDGIRARTENVLHRVIHLQVEGLVWMKTTIVSALFHIKGRDEDSSYRYKNHLYKEWCKNLLGLDSPMIVHTDDYFFEAICEARKRIDPDFSQTVIFKRTVQDLTSYKLFYGELALLMAADDFKRLVRWPLVPEMSQPLYNVITFEKLSLVIQAAAANPFDSELFCWVDMGGIREAVPSGLRWPSNFRSIDPARVNMFTVADRPHDLSEARMQRYFLSQYRFIQGGCFLGRLEPLAALQARFRSVIREYLAKGFVGSEEKVFDFCYLRWPELLNLTRSTPPDEWRQFFHRLGGRDAAARCPREFVGKIDLCPSDLPSLDDCDFYYVGVHDAVGQEIARRDLGPDEVRALRNREEPSFEFSYVAPDPGESWLVWPHSRTHGWLAKIQKPLESVTRG